MPPSASAAAARGQAGIPGEAEVGVEGGLVGSGPARTAPDDADAARGGGAAGSVAAGPPVEYALADSAQATSDESPAADFAKPSDGAGTSQRAKAAAWAAARVVFAVAVGFGMGAVFGMGLDRSGVAAPAVVRLQLVFRKEVMIKYWLAALATVGVCFIVLRVLARDAFEQARCARPWGEKGAVTVTVGALLQGAGYALTGSCPGTVYAQMGAGVPWAWAVFVGGLVGALVHGLVDPWLAPLAKRDFQMTYAKVFTSGFLDEQKAAPLAGRVRFEAAAGLIVVCSAAVLIALEVVFPWQAETSGIYGVRTGATGLMPPSLAGGVIGLLQIPCCLVFGTLIGTSAGYSTVASQWIRLVPPSRRSRARAFFKTASSFSTSPSAWQLVYGLGAVLGGYLSSSGVVVPPPSPGTPNGVGPGFAFVGGFVMILGARVSGGCASGHGLSGVTALAVNGWLALPMMFAGAIPTAFIMQAAMGEEAFSLAPQVP